MSTDVLTCARCNSSLPETIVGAGEASACPGCGKAVRVRVFPALFQESSRTGAGEGIVLDGQGSCFYHALKKAEVVCSGCGRFLCSLCDIDLSTRHLCPKCVETGAHKKKIGDLETRRVHYDSVALSLVIVPILLQFLLFCLPLSLVTAPIAIYLSIRHWNTDLSVLPRTKWRYVVAITLGVLVSIGWVVLAVFLFSAFTSENAFRE